VPATSLRPEVLVVDDDEPVRTLLELGLRRCGFTVRMAANGREAVEMYRRHRDDIAAALLDVQMPGLDGPGTLVALKGLDPDLPCCFVTGDPGTYEVEDLLALGASCVLYKPFRLGEVVEVVRQLAEGHGD
jgi:CheY-like chemotaxis protein